ncbi:MAG: patatin-like phospholipase family protein [Bdellovibrionota bacterium]|nr:MAG: patatin-like phospholipase family protein [Pseudomonadota bacterium]
MRQHLLYVVAPSRLEGTSSAIKRLGAVAVEDNAITTTFELDHKLLKGISLRIYLLTDIDGVTPFLRHHPVDLLVYDERGTDGIEALQGIYRIARDVHSLSQLWGPDFHFPMSRIVTVLHATADVDHRIFSLGRLNVRDVLVEPKKTSLMLRWLHNLLYAGIVRHEKVGIALSGGAVEGLLYQAGTVLALKHAFNGRGIYSCDAISGISSGSIVGSVVANDIEIEELIRGVLDMKSKYPPFKISTLFDLAGFDIVKRVFNTSLRMRKLKPSQWMESTLESIPTGFFKGERLESYLHELFAEHGHGDRFDELDTNLYIGATDHDTFDHVTLGKVPYDHVAISAAVRASCSIPPLFTPKAIGDRFYIDGQVTKSCNIESVVEDGACLVFVIDPMKPLRMNTAGNSDIKGGYFSLLQMIKGLVSTRFETNFRAISEQYPDVDFIVFQPDEECARMMAGSPLKPRIRPQMIEVAFQNTLRRLRERHKVYSAKTARFGFELKTVDELRKLEASYQKILKAMD